MIIDSITLHNFGTYAGEHHLDLAPLDRSRPVILIGGMNGAGKTTILEAIQIGLYGRGSPIALDSSGTYERLLHDRISRSVPASDGASVQLRLRAYEDGRERVLTVRRAWSFRNAKLREDVSILVDGVLDRFLSENWGETSDRVFPARLASLFFFDGEKIEALAHPDSAREAIRTAVETLLGLDVVRQLEADLGTLTRMKVKESAETADSRARAQVIGKLEAKLGEAREEVARLKQEEGALQNNIDSVQARLEKVARDLERTGGHAFENRHQLEQAAHELRNERAGIEDKLRRTAEGDLPLALLRDKVGEVLRQLKEANEDLARHTTHDALRAHGDNLIAFLRDELPGDTRVISLVERFQKSKLATPASWKRFDEPAAVPGAEGRLTYVQEHLQVVVSEARDLVRVHDRNARALIDAERQLAAVPDEAVVQSGLSLRRALIEERTELVQLQSHIRTRLERALADLETLRSKLQREVHEQTTVVERAESEQRIIDHAGLALTTLGRFRLRLVQRHTDRLSQAVLARFRHLALKERLVARIEIRPDDFGLDLYDEHDVPLQPDRLSAGERQLLAVALLWGLSNASGRALPVVVDTPLGRLDSQHRRNLVERYLPTVSHQTIVLSTDEEVDDLLLRVLEPHVSRFYLLKFDNLLGHSVVEPGYFEAWVRG